MSNDGFSFRLTFSLTFNKSHTAARMLTKMSGNIAAGVIHCLCASLTVWIQE